MRIAQFHPDTLGVTGDRGNVDVLARRAELAGIEVERIGVRPGDPTPDADVVVIGNGPLSALRGVADDLRRHAGALRDHVAAGRPLLAVGGGAELLGTSIAAVDGALLPGAGVLPFRSRRTTGRRVGYLVADTADGRLAGFEDHASEWILDDDVTAWARVTAGGGTVAGAREGLRVGAAVATGVQGPVLPLNPWLADLLLRAAHPAYTPGPAHAAIDAHAAGARDAIEARARQHYTVIGL